MRVVVKRALVASSIATKAGEFESAPAPGASNRPLLPRLTTGTSYSRKPVFAADASPTDKGEGGDQMSDTSMPAITYSPAQQMSGLVDSETSSLLSSMDSGGITGFASISGFATESTGSLFSQAAFEGASEYSMYSSNGSLVPLLDSVNSGQITPAQILDDASTSGSPTTGSTPSTSSKPVSSDTDPDTDVNAFASTGQILDTDPTSSTFGQFISGDPNTLNQSA
jgi:hypothetical protein